MTLLVVVLGAGVYAGALPLYLFFKVSRPALALGQATESIAAVGAEVARRDSALDQAAVLLGGLADSRALPAASVAEAHRLVELGRAPVRAPANAAIAPALRGALERTDAAMSRVASALAGLVTRLDEGRRPAPGQLAAVQALDRIADAERVGAAILARDDLLARQHVLREAASEVRRDTIVWVVIGIPLVPALVWVVRRRVWRPLRELEAGLARVADGDLTVRVPIRATDEIGRLALHFNAMTQVLGDRAEEQGRFAAAGELLAGVAHEVNNPLMAIAAHAENRLADPTVADEARSEMSQILRQARRAAKLLRGLLRFVRATEREVTRINLNDVVRGALDLVSYRFGVDEITVGGRLDATLPAVEGDAIKLEQVVVNLLANAIDALRRIKPPRHLTVDTWSADARVCVAVGDNGEGVASEIAPRLFRPFATTKGHRGTGLGLYISRQIAREAGGDLALVSSPGSGARFSLSLPLAPAASATVAPPPTPAPAAMQAGAAGRADGTPAAGGGRVPGASLAGVYVLIVEDEEGVRRPMARFLARRGAEVEEAADGVDGLGRVRARAPDVILVDLRMPRMGGIELYAQLEHERPELAARVLFLSGDVSQLAEPGNTPVPRERVLVKPVELAELERRIAAFVQERKASGG
jgi:signal transduction histidine kinase/CheY-like chemotaxis protein